MTPEERIAQLEEQLSQTQRQLRIAQGNIEHLLRWKDKTPPGSVKPKYTGWLKYEEIDAAWATYLQGQGFTVNAG
jgi:hypothetical protein